MDIPTSFIESVCCLAVLLMLMMMMMMMMGVGDDNVKF
jgi:hypothetical protein